MPRSPLPYAATDYIVIHNSAFVASKVVGIKVNLSKAKYAWKRQCRPCDQHKDSFRSFCVVATT